MYEQHKDLDVLNLAAKKKKRVQIQIFITTRCTYMKV